MGILRTGSRTTLTALIAAVVLAFVASHSLAAQGTGSITGIVTTQAGGLRPVRITIDQKVCGNELPDESIVTNASGALANAVVTVVGVKARGAAPVAAIVNEKCRFVPRVQIVRPNATISTSSSDPVLHTTNAHLGSKTIFNVAVPIVGVKINRPIGGAGLVRLSCNTHPWMRGWVVVTDEVAAVTGADGRFTLNDVPPGTYEVRVWHEAMQGGSQKVTVAAGQAASVNFNVR